MGRRMVVVLTAKQRRELAQRVARAADSAQEIRRAHVVLWSADGVSGAEIARRLHLSAEAVSRIRRRFVETGITGPSDAAESRAEGSRGPGRDRGAPRRVGDVAAARRPQPLDDAPPRKG